MRLKKRDLPARLLKHGWLCHRCVKEKFLSSQINDSGQESTCSYCGFRGNSLALNEVADRFELAFKQHFYQTRLQMSLFESTLQDGEDDWWEPEGEPVLAVIQEAGEIGEEIAKDIRQILHERYRFNDASGFDAESYYAEKEVGLGRLNSEWSKFEKRLKAESRYFNRASAETLSRIFEHIGELQTVDGCRVIVEAGPGTDFNTLYRARVFQSDGKLSGAITRPDLEIGSPPSCSARAGRMNAHGISVFYGATDSEAALAEIRPFVGSKVVVAKFEIIRHLRLLNLERLKSLNVQGSVFDPTFLERLQKAEFLADLSRRMTMPVMPDEEILAYLPTQAVADFLANESDPVLDGIIYPSAQAAKSSQNVVLFHKSALVETLDLSEGTEFEVQLYLQRESDEEDTEYAVVEITPSQPSTQVEQTLPANPPVPSYSTSRRPALKIDCSSLKVCHIKGVRFYTEDHPVYRIRTDTDHFLFRKQS